MGDEAGDDIACGVPNVIGWKSVLDECADEVIYEKLVRILVSVSVILEFCWKAFGRMDGADACEEVFLLAAGNVLSGFGSAFESLTDVFLGAIVEGP